jgi:methyl-accepting chemotaxis protein
MLYEICVVFATGMIGLVSFYLIGTLRAAARTLRRTDEAVDEFRRQLRQISEASLNLVIRTNRTMALLEEHLESASAVSSALRQIGHAVRHAADIAAKTADAWAEYLRKLLEEAESGRKTQWMDWTDLGLHLWNRWHHRQASAKGEEKH